MKITDVRSVILRQSTIEMIGDGSQDTVVVFVDTDAGITGVGEVDSSPYVVKTIIDMPASHMACRGLRDILIGEDPLDVERLWRKMYDMSIYHGRRSAVIHAMSGIDIALWDIIGQVYGVPTAKALGGSYRDKIQAYCSVLMPNTEKEVYELVESFDGSGYQGFKFGWGGLGESFEKDIALVKAARRAIGPDKKLMIDIAMRWTDVKGAMRTVKAFEDLDVYWVEEPFHPDNLDAYTRLNQATNVHISAGEEVGTIHEFRDLLSRGCVDIVQPDLSRCGGLTIGRKLIDLAEQYNVTIIPHAFKTNILMSASLQYIASLPHTWYLEFCEQDTVLRKELTTPIFSVDNEGYVTIPQKPGLGIQVNPNVIDRYKVEV
ncbi:MAG: mandelate racemase/muconate lactonizing enzyme family protein [Clostridia bacterium]|nr:mandelate racemase/muconate lactonizing enzyme family protein [Clostridia bacterium]